MTKYASSLEDHYLMSELLADRFKAVDFLARRVDMGQQLQDLFGQRT